MKPYKHKCDSVWQLTILGLGQYWFFHSQVVFYLYAVHSVMCYVSAVLSWLDRFPFVFLYVIDPSWQSYFFSTLLFIENVLILYDLNIEECLGDFSFICISPVHDVFSHFRLLVTSFYKSFLIPQHDFSSFLEHVWMSQVSFSWVISFIKLLLSFQSKSKRVFALLYIPYFLSFICYDKPYFCNRIKNFFIGVRSP